jgi:hypothetical protein
MLHSRLSSHVRKCYSGDYCFLTMDFPPWISLVKFVKWFYRSGQSPLPTIVIYIRIELFNCIKYNFTIGVWVLRLLRLRIKVLLSCEMWSSVASQQMVVVFYYVTCCFYGRETSSVDLKEAHLSCLRTGNWEEHLEKVHNEEFHNSHFSSNCQISKHEKGGTCSPYIHLLSD